MVSSPGPEALVELDLDDIFGGPALSDDEVNAGDENCHPNLPIPNRPSGPIRPKLLWRSAGVYEGPECAAHAKASLTMHAQELWFEPKSRKSRGEKTPGIPLTQTPRILADGTVVSEFRCPFSQVLPYLRTHHPSLPAIPALMKSRTCSL